MNSTIRTKTISGTTYYATKDIASIFNLSDYTVKRYVSPEDKILTPLESSSGVQNSAMINSNGVIALSKKSKLPQDKISRMLELLNIEATPSDEASPAAELTTFTSPDFGSIRTVIINDSPWFVGKDIAEILGYSNTRDALAIHVDREDKNTVVIPDGKRGNPNHTLINESGLYSLILSSKLPSAKKFKHWVTSEVLPSIRKHGLYATEATLDKIIADPSFGIQLLTALKEEQEARRKAEQLIEEQKDKIDYQTDIINSLTADLPVPEMRALVNRIVRRSFPYAQRWNLLYREVNYMHHVNLKKRFENYNENHPETRYEHILDYADKELHMIPQIFETCLKIYASDADEIVKHYYKMREGEVA